MTDLGRNGSAEHYAIQARVDAAIGRGLTMLDVLGITARYWHPDARGSRGKRCEAMYGPYGPHNGRCSYITDDNCYFAFQEVRPSLLVARIETCMLVMVATC